LTFCSTCSKDTPKPIYQNIVESFIRRTAELNILSRGEEEKL